MPSEVHVHLLPDHVPAEQLRGGIAVVVDILRASTTILTALDHGADSIYPCLTVEDAVDFRAAGSHVLLGGERGGIRLEGFDLSNSPTDYSPEVVGQQTIGFTTTNGTRALLHSAQADHVLIGAFVGINRLAQTLRDQSLPLHIVCAGTNGAITGEDVLFAGCLTDRLLACCDTTPVLPDTTAMALSYWRHEQSSRPLADSLKHTQGGRNLLKLKYDGDIELAAQQNSHPVLAVWNSADGHIRAADSL